MKPLMNNHNYRPVWYKAFLVSGLLILSSPLLSIASLDHQYEESVALIRQHQYDEAIVRLLALEEAVVNPQSLSGLLAVAYLGQGYQLLAAGEYVDARESFQTGRLYNEEDVRLWQGEALAFFKEGRYADASSLIEQALGYDNHSAALYSLQGQAYYAEGRMPEAIDSLTRSLDINDSEEVSLLLQKVEREWQVEQEMEQESRGNFQLSFVDGVSSDSLSKDILAVLEEAYNELGSELDYYPEVRVPVLLYTRSEYAGLTGSPDWSGGVYDGKIRLPVANMHHMTDPLKALLYHEYMHVIVHYMVNRHVPVWLNEGLAEFAGRRIFSPGLVDLSRDEYQKQLLDWSELSRSFQSLDTAQALIAYEQSYSMVNHMIDNYGLFKMAELLKQIGKAGDWQASVAFVYEDYGLDWPAILREWQAGLK